MLVPSVVLLAIAATPAAASTAQAKSHSVKIRKVSKLRSVSGPVAIVAVPRGRPRAVSFLIDGRLRYRTRTAPYDFGGPGGRFDPSTLKAGKHRVTVRAAFARKRVAKATTVFRVRKKRTTTISPVTNQPVTVVTTVTNLPTAWTQPSAARADWDGSADNGFSPWAQVQDGAHDPQFGNTLISIVSSPIVGGRKAFKFASTPNPAANGPRAELADGYRLREGDDFWFGDVLYVPGGQPQWMNNHHAVMQWKNEGTGSPPLGLDIRYWGPTDAENGLMATGAEPGGQRYRLIVPMARLYDRPIPIEVHIKFSSNPSVGYYEVWADGQRAVGPIPMATLYAGLTSGLKQGQYGAAAGNVVYWHGAKRGASRAAVRR